MFLFGFHCLCTLTLVYRIQTIGHSYIAQMEWPQIVPHEICIYLLYVCYSSENKQQQQQLKKSILFHSSDTSPVYVGTEKGIRQYSCPACAMTATTSNAGSSKS